MRKILLGLVCLLLIVGCNKKEENISDKEYDVMKEQLVNYGKLIYDRYINNEEMLEEGTQYMTLRDMSEHIGHDISMFVNPETKKPCDIDQSKIEIIISKPVEEGKNNYKFNPVLVCE